MGAWSAERGMVALSRGTVLVSGSGVLVVGDVGTGFWVTRGFLYKSHAYTQFHHHVIFGSQFTQKQRRATGCRPLCVVPGCTATLLPGLGPRFFGILIGSAGV